MIVLYVILGIVAFVIALIFAVLLVPIRADVEFDKKISYDVSLFGITIYTSGRRNKKRKFLKGKPEEENPTVIDRIGNFLNKLENLKELDDTLKSLSAITSAEFKALGFFLKRLNLKRFVLDVKVGGDDAAETAIKYGEICAVVYPLLGGIASNVRFSGESIDIAPDFDAKTTKTYLSVRIGTNIFTIVSAILKLAEKQI